MTSPEPLALGMAIVELEQRSRPKERTATPTSNRSLRILVVDNDADVANTTAMVLKLRGHQVHVAYGGEQALADAPGLGAQLILLDIGMPGLNGYEVCRRLRAHPATSDTMIVAVTAWGHEEDRKRSEKAGFDSHFVKPIDARLLDDLLDAIACEES
jgi:CheY-like chemotaxis protein